MIGFRKKAEHPGAISLDKGDNLTPQSAEVARIWVTNNAGSSVWIDAHVLADPVAFGYLITSCQSLVMFATDTKCAFYWLMKSVWEKRSRHC